MRTNKTDDVFESNDGASQFYGKVVGRHQSSGLLLTEVRHSAGRRLPLHSHESAYFCLLLDGAYWEYYGSRTFTYKPMTIMFHPPELTHQDEVGDKGGHFFSIEMDSRWMDRLKEFSKIPKDIIETGSSDLLWLGMRLYREFQEPGVCAALAIEGLVTSMLADMASCDGIKREKCRPLWLRRAVDLIEAQFSQKLTLTRIAAEVGVHPFHLSKVFRQFHHQTVGDYVKGLRVRFACARLSDQEREISDISLEAGFADQSHFTRVFKHITGLTPGAYRVALGRGKTLTLSVESDEGLREGGRAC